MCPGPALTPTAGCIRDSPLPILLGILLRIKALTIFEVNRAVAVVVPLHPQSGGFPQNFPQTR
jgi:hypothetical protein